MGEAGAALVGSRGWGFHNSAAFQGCVLASLWTAELSVNKHLAHLVLCTALGTPQGLEGCSLALLS